METFDELFDRFFNNGNKKPKKSKKQNMSDKIKKIIDSLSDFTEVSKNKDEDDLITDLGEPTKVQFFEESGLYFKRSIWKIEDKGELVKLEVSDLPFEDSYPKKTLEELLEDAINEENYEKAAKIRDEINKNKKIIKKT
jgi:hypothetical protein